MNQKNLCILAGMLVSAVCSSAVARAAEPAATKEIRIDSLTFTLPSGLRIDKVASEPLVKWPIVADWDSQGRLVVAESGGVAKPIQEHNQQKLHRIIRLVDSDGDRRFDKRIVAADALAFPEGVLCIENSILVSAPPEIWKLTDRDGDGVCEEREVWFDGQTITGCANDLHGPYLGRDGWIYWCKGAFAKQTHDLINGRRLDSTAAHIFRRRLSGGPIEPVMTGGMDNPVEVAFTPEGERFFTSTFLQHPGNGQRDGIAHAVYGGVYGKDQKAIDGHVRTGDLMPIMTQLGPAAPSGLLCLESKTLLASSGIPVGDHSYLAAAQFNLQKVSLHELRPEGSTFQTTDHVLVKGSRIDFHPTDVIEDADGSLLVIDTGGWYNLCCPSSKVDQQTAAGGIYRISSDDTERVADPRGDQIAWASLTVERAVELLGDNRAHVRKRARQWCLQASAIDAPLQAAIMNEALTPRHRIEAVWTACGRDNDLPKQAVVAGLQSSQAAVRQAAAHAVSVQRLKSAREMLEQLVEHDPSDVVSRAAAEALGRVGDPDSVQVLLRALVKRAPDRVLEHSMLYAMIELNQPDAMFASLASKSAREAVAALIVLDQLQALDDSHAETVFSLASSQHPQTSQAALNVLRRHPAWAASLETQLDTAFGRPTDPDHGIAIVRSVADAWENEPAFQDWTSKHLRSIGSYSPEQRARLLSVISAFRFVSPPADWEPAIATWLQSADSQSVTGLLSWIARWSGSNAKSSVVSDALVKLADEPQRSASDRLQLLAALPSPKLPTNENLTLIVEHFLKPGSEHHQLANQALSRVSLDPPHAQQLVKSIDQVESSKLMTLATAVSRLGQDAMDQELIARLMEIPAGKTLSSDSLRNLYRKRSEVVRSDLERAISALSKPTEAVASQVDAMLATLTKGDAIRGFELFRSERAACHSCHRIAFVGGTVGPELSHIGATRTRRDILEAILFPSSRLEQSYQPIRVLTTDGVVHNGMVKSETDRVLELALDATRVVSIDKDDIELREPSTVSIMPAGLAELLTRDELADLLAFLESAK
ncbi:MAG: PVC-type heme-binding CxxCH protein [Planctomycetaceae bacterium]